MDEYFYRMSFFVRKREKIKNMPYMMKAIAALLVFTVSFCSLSQPDTMRMAWYILFPVIWIVFFCDVHFVKQDKKIEYQIYELEKKEMANKIEMARITSEDLPDKVLNRKIIEPSLEYSIPLVYYIIITVVALIIMLMLL